VTLLCGQHHVSIVCNFVESNVKLLFETLVASYYHNVQFLFLVKLLGYYHSATFCCVETTPNETWNLMVLKFVVELGNIFNCFELSIHLRFFFFA
jgi:hypothetical protein